MTNNHEPERLFLTKADRAMFQHILGNEMSADSEKCFSAGWINGCEDVLPNLYRLAVNSKKPQDFGQGSITPERGAMILRLREFAGTWVDYSGDETEYVPYIPNWW